MKRVIKGAIVFMLLYFCIMGNQQTIHAETVDVQNEYLQKKSAGREVYEITSQSGKFMGYYEPSFLENLDIMPRTRVRYNVGNWTISANTTSWTCEFQRTADHRRHKPNRKRCVSRALPFYVQHDNYSVAAALSVSLAASVASVLPASSVLSVLSVPVSL